MGRLTNLYHLIYSAKVFLITLSSQIPDNMKVTFSFVATRQFL